jgi:signal transduction histidine kinase
MYVSDESSPTIVESKRWLGTVAPFFLGGLLLAGAIWNFKQELSQLSVTLPPVIAAVVVAVPACTLLGASVLLWKSHFTDGEVLHVGGWSIAGAVVTTVAQALTIGVRLLEDRPFSEPQFPLMVMAGIGGIAGFLIGWLYVDLHREATEARRARDAMVFVNRLLRHDVRNGIQVIRTHADIVAETGDGQVRDSGDSIREQADSLEAFTRDIQAVADLLQNEATPTVIDLADRLADAVDTAGASFPSVTFETDIPDGCVVVGTDALGPVFTNLLNNAVQHNDASDLVIRVAVTERDETVQVTIADNGTGIDPEDRERVFESGVGTDSDGGFGLYIVRTLLERSGGTIRVEDSDLGGAAFVVELPAAEPFQEAQRSGEPRR